MKDEEIFTKIETEEEKKLNNIEEQAETPFVTGLPDWDLEPLYEPLKRGNTE